MDLGLNIDTNVLECNMCLSIMIVICIKQHLSNIWGSIYEKVKQHRGWVEEKKKKSIAHKKVCIRFLRFDTSSVLIILTSKNKVFSENKEWTSQIIIEVIFACDIFMKMKLFKQKPKNIFYFKFLLKRVQMIRNILFLFVIKCKLKWN